MHKIRCQCGKSLKAADEHVGRLASCPVCHRKIRITAGPSLTLEEPPVANGSCPNCAVAVPPEARICVKCGVDLITGRPVIGASTSNFLPEAAGGEPAAGELGAYVRDCLLSFALLLGPGELLRIVVLALFLVVASFASVVPGFGLLSIIRLLVTIVALGWVFSYFFNVIVSAAAGEESLPDFDFSDGVLNAGFFPFFKFVGMWLLVLLPAIVYAVTTGSIRGLVSAADPILKALVWLGVFMWPIAMLVTAIGGLGCFARPDLILLSVARSFPAYVVAWAMTALAFGLQLLASHTLAGLNLTAGRSVALGVVLVVFTVYCWVVAMRCIGLYYHHFKGRLAWSWG